MTDLGRLLRVTLEAARVDANRPVLGALRSWLDSWRGIGAVERGHGAPGVRPPAHRLRRTRLARHLLPDRVQPNHEKPINMLPTAPTTTPQAAGLNHGTCNCMTHLSASDFVLRSSR